jgi:S1-C subfamily serine protease
MTGQSFGEDRKYEVLTMKKMQFIKWAGLLLGVVALGLLGLSVTTAQDATPGYLGVRFVAAEGGVLVVEVVADSPAADAGLKVGDFLLTVNGEPVEADTVRDAIQAQSAGDTLTLGIERRGEPMDVDVTLGEAPAAASAPQLRFNQRDMTTDQPYLGIGINAADDGGVVISLVEDNSPAGEAGLQVDDRITQVNGSAVATPQDVVAAVQAMNVGDTATLTIERGGETMDVDVTLGSAPLMVMPFDRGFGRGGMSLQNGQFGLSWSDGKLQITDLAEDHPLYAAGLRAGDSITAVNGQPLDDLNLMMSIFRDMNTDGTITLAVDRDGESLDIDVDAATLVSGFHFFMTPGMDMQGFFGQGFHRFFGQEATPTPEPNA